MSKVYIIKEIESISLTLPLIIGACSGEGEGRVGRKVRGWVGEWKACLSPSSVITHKGEDAEEGLCEGNRTPRKKGIEYYVKRAEYTVERGLNTELNC